MQRARRARGGETVSACNFVGMGVNSRALGVFGHAQEFRSPPHTEQLGTSETPVAR
jgi:hypothetical protein